MDNRSIEQIAAAESPAFAAAAQQVGVLERRRDCVAAEISQLEAEAALLAEHIAKGEYQNPRSSMTREALQLKLDAAKSALATAQRNLVNVSNELSAAWSARDRALSEFQAAR